MKILKHGNSKPRKFICWRCDCEFIAEVSEYEAEMVCGEPLLYIAFCPECGAETNKSCKWEEQDEN
jgi:hypothetical protein